MAGIPGILPDDVTVLFRRAEFLTQGNLQQPRHGERESNERIEMECAPRGHARDYLRESIMSWLERIMLPTLHLV